MALRNRLLFPLLCLAVLASACAVSGSSSGSTAAPIAATASPAATPSASATPSPAAAFPVTLADDAERQVTLTARAERIVSLAPSNTEIVCALGACDRIVGVNDFRDGFPPTVATALAAVPDVASFGGVDREAVVAAEPDLVLAAGNELTSSADIEAMNSLGMPVLVLYPESLDGVYADIALVGRAIGEEEAAAQLTGRMRSRVDDLQARIAGLDAPRTFYEVGIYEGAIYTAGAESFLASLIGLAGGDAITGDALSTAIQLEDLVAADPQLILLGDAAYDATITPASVSARPGWGTMAAVREGRILPMPDDLVITRPGPRIVDGLEALARAIHPEAFD
jgi:iron complex transport system substrate-binding protein